MKNSKASFDNQFSLIQNSFLNKNLVKFVAVKYPKHQEKLLKTLKEEKIDNKFDMYMIFDPTRLHRLIDAEILKVFDPNCAKTIKGKIEKIAKKIRTEIKIHLTTNECITMEICTKRSVHSDDFLKSELIPYVESFEKSINESRFDYNQNIKDETIYDVIESILKIKNVEEYKCVVEYIKRSNLIDEKIFETLGYVQMWREVDKFVKKYKNVYG